MGAPPPKTALEDAFKVHRLLLIVLSLAVVYCILLRQNGCRSVSLTHSRRDASGYAALRLLPVYAAYPEPARLE